MGKKSIPYSLPDKIDKTYSIFIFEIVNKIFELNLW